MFLLVFLLSGATLLLAQAPPSPSGDTGDGSTPVGGAAPLIGGIALLMGMVVGYGAMKLYYNRKKTA